MSTLAWTVQRGGDEIDVEVLYTLEPYYPARIYGPPEDCYPAEGGDVEELAAYLDGKEFALSAAEITEIEAHIYDNHEY